MARKHKPSGRGYKPRRVNSREPLQRFLIVCEGEKTEPTYFQGFHVPSVVTVKVKGVAKDPLTLVECAHKLRGKNRYDQVWCVFDKDDVLPERFNQAVALAQRYKIKPAYSNQAFELWYLLHFHYCHVAMTRKDYVDKLSRDLNRAYRKNDDTLYRELLPKQNDAIQNAERLLAEYNPKNPAFNDPSTTVHLLVQELKRFVR
ncbi:MAG: RloB domain-containing protein [Chloroflexi bacterium]|nr:RloB domain-containing protein [Chloroflexota bacterium]